MADYRARFGSTPRQAFPAEVASFAARARRPCPLAVCDCPIGCVHLESLPLHGVFAGGALERVPAGLRPPSPGRVRRKAFAPTAVSRDDARL